MRALALLLALALTALATPALAGWDRTQWGMSRSEVLTAYPQAVEESVPYYTSADAPPQSRRVLVLSSWTFAGKVWPRVELSFNDSGALSTVKLDSTERFGDLKDQLAGQFGSPVSASSECHGTALCTKHAVFADRSKNNQITVESLDFISTSTWVKYEQLPSGF